MNPAGVSQYLTSIISSPLAWLPSDEAREAVWDAASARLCERSGRTGMVDMVRKFKVPVLDSCDEGDWEDEEMTVELALREPTLTADNLGNKTWVSSFLLARRLKSLLTPPPLSSADSAEPRLRALELGAGTGLVGLSFASLFHSTATTHLTDLPAIVPNIAHNITLNSSLLTSLHADVTSGVLDWSITSPDPIAEEEKYDIILAADPLYSPDHPRWLVQTIERWLRRRRGARVVAEMPLRTPYLPQIREFKTRMGGVGLEIKAEGEEVGYDDWEGMDGRPLEVRCWWSVWWWREGGEKEEAAVP